MADLNLLLDSAVAADDDAAPAGATVAEESVVAAAGAVSVPETGVEAEVVIVMTSLGAARKAFFSSKRAMQLLDCKGHPYYVIDTNKDVGQDRLDQPLIAQWQSQSLLAPDPRSTRNPFLLPQVLIDGVTVGTYQDLQDLEEDDDLDWILVRASCPSCLGQKEPDASSCPHCGVLFQELIPMQAVEDKLVVKWQRGLPVNLADPYEGVANFGETYPEESLFEI